MSINYLDRANFDDNKSLIRLVVLFGLGLLVAGSLTFFMHVLIESSEQDLDESGRANMLDFVRVKKDESSQRKEVKPKRPELNKPPPAPPLCSTSGSVSGAATKTRQTALTTRPPNGATPLRIILMATMTPPLPLDSAASKQTNRWNSK